MGQVLKTDVMSFANAQLAAHDVACLLSSVSRMEFNAVKGFTTAWSLGRFALTQGEKGRCATSAFHSPPGWTSHVT